MMDEKGKSDLIRTALLVTVFLAIALLMLNYVIGSSMDPAPPKL